jgi:hypothetical protein
MVPEQGKIEVDAAFVLLRDHARYHNLALAEVARSALEGELDAGSLRQHRGATPR